MQPVARLLLVLLLVGFLPNNSTFAESRSQTQATDHTLLGQLQQQTGGQLHIERHAETGKVRFLAATPGQPIKRPRSLSAAATPAQAARGFLDSYGTLFGLRSQVDEVVEMRDLTVGNGSFVRFQQRYRGVPVLGGELVVQTDGQRNVVTANGEVLPDVTIDTTPRISAQQAQEQARAAVAQSYKLAANQLTVGQPQLAIFNPALLGGPGLRITRLTWRMEVRATVSDTPLRELTLVDARNGSVVLRFNQIASAKERYICDQKNVRDTDYDPDNNCQPPYVRSEGQPDTNVTDVDRAYEYSGATYDYYYNNFKRDSIDGNGMPLISLVRYCFPTQSCPFQNAFWDGQQMTYGSGYASADDVVGHELTHGVTERTSNLFYYYQSGAINEAMSDIFGELIDLSYKGSSDNVSASVRWDIGEDLPSSVGVIRNMANPNTYNQPDRMTDTQFYDDDPYFQDNGGVHTNSGVANKAAYLIADGESFNTYTIRGLGLDKMGQIFYRVNTALLTSGSDYQDLGDALPAACQSLIGTAGIVASDCDEVAKVVKATEMEQQPLVGAALEAAMCASGKYVNDTFYDDLENTASGTWVSAAVSGTVNAWYYPQQNAPNDLLQQFGGASYATSGTNNFWGYDQGDGNPGDYAIAMTRDVTVPANAFFYFRHAYDFETAYNRNTSKYDIYIDGGTVEYSLDRGATWQDAGPLFDENGYTGNLPQESDTTNPLHDRSAFTGVSYGYTSSRADLSTLAGKKVRFRFRIGTDSYNPNTLKFWGWFIDDIRIYTCDDAPPVTQPTVAFSNGSMRVGRDAGIVQLPVTLSSAVPMTVTVRYSVSGGTAMADKDFALTGDALVFPPNVTTQSIPVAIINDPDSNADRTVTVTLHDPQQASIGTAASITLTIVNNNPKLRTYLPLLSR